MKPRPTTGAFLCHAKQHMSSDCGTLCNMMKVAITDLLTDDFVKRHTNYNSLAQMVQDAGVQPKDIMNPPFHIFCCYRTDFHSWDDFLEAAKAEYRQRMRSLGL